LSYPPFHPAWLGDLPMVLSREGFAEAFPGEGEHVEFKQGVSVSRAQEAAVAFSNSDGGVLIAGVAPDGRIVGVAQPGEKAKDLHQALRDARDPGRYEVRELVVDDLTLLVLSVDRRREGFSQTSAGAVLVRGGASNVPLLGAELSRFIARHAFEAFELTPTGYDLDEVDPQLVERLRNAYGWEAGSYPAAVVDAGFATIESGRRMLTVAGSLLLLPDPAVTGGRPYIDIRRYPVDDPDPDKLWEVRGPVDHQIEQATADVLSELGSVSAIVGVQRVEMPKLPPRAIREAIANAVAHRSYEHAGTAVRIEIRSTSLTITSPGSLPEPVTIENLRFQQSARNDRLLGALRRLGLAEDLGKGIDRIEDDMAAELLQPPVFEDDGSFFTVRLRLGGAVTPRERAWVRSLIRDRRLDPRAAVVVVAVAREGSISNSEVRALLDVDSVQARALLQLLVSETVLERKGERGGAQYVIAPELGVPARIRHTDAELDELAMSLAAQGPVTNALLRDRTGLDNAESRAVLQRLAGRGDLVRLGERRGSRYVLP
jgi:ATP-dependent DNA helicase RecG